MATVYKNRQMIYLAIIFFFYFSSIGCFAPFLTSHMRHLGFSLPEVSFINAVAAFFSLLGPVVCGTLAERFGKYKCFTIITAFFGALAVVALSFIPRSTRMQYRPLVDFSCQSGLRIERCVNWDTCRDALDHQDNNLTTVQLSDCHYQCQKDGRLSSAHPLHICFKGHSGNICVVYDPETGNSSAAEFRTKLSAWPFDEKRQPYVNVSSTDENEGSDVFDIPLTDPEYIPIKKDRLVAEVDMCNFYPKGPISFNDKHYDHISCRPEFIDCTIHCRASFVSGGVLLQPNLCEEANGDPSVTFWSYLVIRCVLDFCLLTTVCLLDALLVASTSDFEGAYGRLHLWPALGIAAFAPFSGALLDHFTDMDGKADHSPSAFVAAGLGVLTCALVLVLPVRAKGYLSPQFQCLIQQSKSSKSFSAELCIFLAMVIVLGMQWGIIFTFLPWMAMDIGCSNMKYGLGFTMIFGCSLPFLLISKNMVRNIGRANLLVFALLFYGTRYAGVSFVSSTWWTLPFAAMGAFTLCVMWIAVVAYGQSLAPFGYNLVMQYVLNLLHFGIGRGIGCLLGGTLISHHGLRVTFRGVAVFSASLGLVFLALYHLALKKKKASQKSAIPVAANGSWYPLREQRPNGDTKVHHPIIADVEDDVSDITSNNTASTK